MSTDPPELGKGLFGYRRSAVNQILADRDVMLRQAEGRVRAAESKVAELEAELASIRDRNNRMDEQLERLRGQFDALSVPGTAPAQDADDWRGGMDMGTDVEAGSEGPGSWHQFGSERDPSAHAEDDAGLDEGFGRPEATFAGLDALPIESSEPSRYDLSEPADPGWGMPVEADMEGSAEDLSHSPWLDLDQEPHPVQEEEGDDLAYGHYSNRSYQDHEPSPTDQPFPFPFGADDAADQPLPPHESSEVEPARGSASPEPVPPAAGPQPEARHDHEPEAEDVASPADPGVSTASIDLTNRFLTDEIQGILSAAEDSAARIVDRARTTSQNQIAQSNRLWREVQSEVSRFAAWREQVEPVIRSVQAKVEGVRAEIDSVAERIRQALAPMADSISTIDSDLAELAAACSPPLLLTPSGLELEADQMTEWDDQDTGMTAGQDEDGSADVPPVGEAPAEGEDGSGHLAG